METTQSPTENKQVKSKAYLLLVIGLILTFIVTAYAWKIERDIAYDNFSDLCENTQVTISNRMNKYEQVLLSGRALFYASDNVSAEEWKKFVDSLQLNENLPGILSVGYAESIYPSEMESHLEYWREIFGDSYHVWPEGERDHYTSLVFIGSTYQDVSSALGYDMYSQSNRQTAMIKSLNENTGILSDKIILVTEEENKGSIILYLPVFDQSVPITTIAQRSTAIKGWVVSAFRLDDLIDGMLVDDFTLQNNAIDFVLTDITNEKEEIYYQTESDFEGESFLTKTLDVEIEGRMWRLSFVNTTPGSAVDYYSIVTIFIFGLIITFFLYNQTVSQYKLNLVLESSVKRLEKEYQVKTEEVTTKNIEILKANERFGIQVHQLKLLSQITQLITGGENLPTLFRSALGQLVEQFKIDLTTILYYDKESNILIIGDSCYSKALDQRMQLFEKNTAFKHDEEFFKDCLSGKTVYFPNTEKILDTSFSDIYNNGCRSAAFVPVRGKESIHGILLVARVQEDDFSELDIEFLDQLASHIGIAISQVRLLEDLRHTGETLKATQDQIMQQERLRAMGEMASGIAHDINNNLGPMTIIGDMMLEDPSLSPSHKEQVTSLIRACENASKTIAGLRNFYRLPDSEVVGIKLSLNKVIEDVIQITRPRWKDMLEKDGIVISITTKLSDKLPDIIGFSGEIQNALTNLIFNAIEAMPSGGAISVSTTFAEQTVWIQLTDNGSGMDGLTKKKCVEPFFTTKGEKGTGLGMSMVHGVMNRHNGKIEIESSIGNGTSVSLGFPVGITSVTKSAPVNKTNLTPKRTMRILCVDDDEFILNSVQELLTRDGHLVTACSRGLEAIEVMNSGARFDALITDLGMPHIDGRELNSKLKKIQQNLPSILLTSWGSHLIDEDQQQSEFIEILAKPPRIAALRSALAACLETLIE